MKWTLCFEIHSFSMFRTPLQLGGKQPLKRYPDISWGSVPLGPPLSLPAAGRNQQLKQQHLLSPRLLQPYTCIGNAWKSHFPITLKACLFFPHQFETSKAITDSAWGGCFLRTSCHWGEECNSCHPGCEGSYDWEERHRASLWDLFFSTLRCFCHQKFEANDRKSLQIM